jgi:drug/metabolite transporter (DMT)-like permease
VIQQIWLFFVLAAAAGKTAFYTYQKKLTEDFSSLELSFYASLASLPILLPLAGFRIWTSGIQGSLGALPWVILIGVLNIAALWVYLEALSETELGIAGSLKALNPVLVAVFEPLFLGTVFSPFAALGCLLAGVGGYVLLIEDRKFFLPLKRIGERGTQLGFLTAAVYATASVGSRYGATSFSPFVFGAIITSVMAAGFFLAMRHTGRKISLPSRRHLGALGFMNSFKNVAIWIAYSLASATSVTAVAQLTVIFNILAGGYFLKEDNLLMKLLGGFLILAGIVLVVTH